VSGEERYIVLLLEVLPLPLLPDGSLPASLEGEELVALEFAYTSITEEGTDLRLESQTSAHLVRIQGRQDLAEVIQNTELIAVIANQQAADAMRKAADALAGGAAAAAALQHLTGAKRFLVQCAARLRVLRLQDQARHSKAATPRTQGQECAKRTGLRLSARKEHTLLHRPNPFTDQTHNPSGYSRADSRNQSGYSWMAKPLSQGTCS
jgi:hypothetical protein